MPRGKGSKLKSFVTLAAFGAIGWVLWSLFAFHRWEPRGPVTAAEAESRLGVRVPPEATNIRAATYRQWIQCGQYLRFEAPTDVCLRCAAAVVPGAATQPAGSSGLSGDTHPARQGAFEDFRWFDLNQAQNVVTAGGGPSQPQVWVDQNRGVFYYRMTD